MFHSTLTLLDDSGLNEMLFASPDPDSPDSAVEKELSCVSRQLYPDGSAIFETMARTSVTVVAGWVKEVAGLFHATIPNQMFL